jgi:hypothetical protein
VVIRDFFGDLFSNRPTIPSTWNPRQLYLVDDLRFTRDPFDALIVAAARHSICRC